MEPLEQEDLFEPVLTYPDVVAREELAALVGLDEHKERLSKMLTLLIAPNALREWAGKYHKGATAIVDMVLSRPPLVILSGDVGCGKTALAESIADSVAREQEIDITLFPMSLSARGKGAVGEMTRLISTAFQQTYSEARKLSAIKDEKSQGAVILLIDEADALAQSREAAQMHHEDRAGVNALIRGIDRLARAHLPAAVLMCTNRPKEIDPAVQRRAADILVFERPNKEQRKAVLEVPLAEFGLNDVEIDAIVEATGARCTNGGEASEAFTYSDLTQRLIPNIALGAFPSRAVDAASALEIARRMRATRPFEVDAIAASKY